MDRITVRFFCISLLLTSAFAQIPAGNVCNGGYFSGSQQCTDSTGRIYRVVVPANLPANAPLIVALHPTQASTVYAANGMMSTTGWDLTTASAKGFLAIFPEATVDANGKKNWCIDFNGCTVDDVAFIRSLIVRYAKLYGTDPKRNYVAGFSMGADMTHKMARNASDLIAAAASVEGHEWVQLPGTTPHFPPIEPVSFLILCGGKDYILPCAGGDPNPTTHVPSVDDDFSFWENVAKLQPSTPANPLIFAPGKMLSHKINTGSLLPPTVSPVPYSQTLSGSWTWDGTKWNASGLTTITIVPPAPPNLTTNTSVAIEFYGLPNGGHNWYRTSMTDPTQPSYQPDVAASFPAGTTTSDLVLQFFLAHPKP